MGDLIGFIIFILVLWLILKILKGIFSFLFGSNNNQKAVIENTSIPIENKEPVISSNNKLKNNFSSEESNFSLLDKKIEEVPEEKINSVHESSSTSWLDNINPQKVIDMLEIAINEDVESSLRASRYDSPNEKGVMIYADFDVDRRFFMVAPYWEHLPKGRITLGLLFTNVERFWLEGNDDEEMKSLYYAVEDYLYHKSPLMPAFLREDFTNDPNETLHQNSSLSMTYLSADFTNDPNETYNRQIISKYELHWDPSTHGDCCDEYNLERIVLDSLTKIRFEYLRAVNYAKQKTEIYHW